ncbi:MAG TPA: 2-oxoglutarate dehydrogenase complex dihydrolipoyllysine-residue succinyltransferase [Dongiaceae bacterium]|jgi:2-oxoglutarate dehydrogenase E2 component (dihydrolipoamide succinyltransferase)|nr:2-oxoglutarate dehydrogenase complex dihydrolipoyllysine-residue succinyltransferase [Dongiaceae bacterium]
MSTNIVVPALGESITEATVAKWMKTVGEPVKADEPLLELETDKVTLEVFAPAAGVLSEIKVDSGATVEVGAVLGVIGDGAGAATAPAKPAAKQAGDAQPGAVEPQPKEAPKSAPQPAAAAAQALSPAVRKLIEESGLDTAGIPASGKDGRLTKGDVLAVLEARGKTTIGAPPAAPASAPASAPPAAKPAPTPAPPPAAPRATGPREERVRMTRLRKRIAERLKEAQDTAAMLTTFNEVDMTNVLALRNAHKEAFEKKHGVKLGFMSFFVKAAIVALKEIPAVNGEIDGDDIVYKNHYDIGVAVSTEQGLVVPVVRDADQLSFAGIEAKIAEYGRKARDGKLTIEELTGGTFTISNGGVFGSLMSTPILNPPQSGILGMHKTQPRPVAIGDKVEIRPMMYLALSYDHRIIDGREAVTFLVRVKECIEDPQRILLDM